MLAPASAIASAMPATLVRAEIIHHDDIARSERRCEELLDIGVKPLTGHWSIKDERGDETSGAKPRHKRRGMPVPVRRGIDLAFPAWMPAVVPHHVGADPGLIDKHEGRRIHITLPDPPEPATLSHVRPLLLGRVQRRDGAVLATVLWEPQHVVRTASRTRVTETTTNRFQRRHNRRKPAERSPESLASWTIQFSA